MEMESLRDLYVDELRDLLYAENQIIKALPKMAKKANSPDLQQAFENHLEETREHVERLNTIFENMGMKPRAKKCPGMEGIIKEGSDMLSEDADADVLDAGIIAAAQRVEHYEIASYGTVRTYANLLGKQNWAELLQQTLSEEKAADQKLNALAEHINMEAQAA